MPHYATPMELSPDITLILVGISIVLSIVAITLSGMVLSRLKKLLEGTDKKSLESSILELKSMHEQFQAFKQSSQTHLKSIDTKLQSAVRGVATVRFNPFNANHVGGGQSFATAYLDQSGNGVVLSSIHTRDKVSVFAKPIKNGTSEYELSPEEKQAISQAKENIA